MFKKWKQKKLSPFWQSVHHYNSKLIPFALVILFGIIIFELFIHIKNPTIELVIRLLDYLVIAVFVIDLVFLALRARSIQFFFRNYWLDILAVIPLAPFFTLFDYLYRAVTVTREITVSQAILHESLEVEKSVSALSKESRLLRFSKVIIRSVRVITKSRFFTVLFHHRTHKKKRR